MLATEAHQAGADRLVVLFAAAAAILAGIAGTGRHGIGLQFAAASASGWSLCWRRWRWYRQVVRILANLVQLAAVLDVGRICDVRQELHGSRRLVQPRNASIEAVCDVHIPVDLHRGPIVAAHKERRLQRQSPGRCRSLGLAFWGIAHSQDALALAAQHLDAGPAVQGQWLRGAHHHRFQAGGRVGEELHMAAAQHQGQVIAAGQARFCGVQDDRVAEARGAHGEGHVHPGDTRSAVGKGFRHRP